MGEKTDSDKSLAVFEGKKIRRVWHDDEWFFSVVDIVKVLTDSSVPKRYWSDLKFKLQEEGFEAYDKIVPLKLIAEDGKLRFTDCASTKVVTKDLGYLPELGVNKSPFDK